MLHNIFHVLLLAAFLATVTAGFLGLMRPMIESGSGLKLPGPRTTALLFLGAAFAGGADWILHRYLL